MVETYNAYIPRDRLMALSCQEDLPSQSTGGVLFADISGFTPLTEAFEAHLGARLGGEELTRILNRVYARLIEEVDRMQGSVIGFAGDAITCWFEGDDGSRAVNAALAMQEQMRQFEAIPAPGGKTIALGLKAAIATGAIKRFAVGNPRIQRVDVLAGDPVYRVAAVEHLANRGEVLVDHATLKLLAKDIWVGEQREDEDVVAYPVNSFAITPQLEPWPSLESVEAERELVDPWVISAIRNRLSSGLGDFFTELRPATAMFVKFEGIDFEEDENADSKLDEFFSKVQTIVDEHEGVVHQLTVGDKGSFLYAAFGAPISHEDDTRRALSVALALVALSKELEFIKCIRVGIGRGSTRTGAYGGPTRRTYGVLGDQVNLAARLMGKSADNQILVSDAAAKEGKTGFKLVALPPFLVKGKTHPITAYSLEGIAEFVPRSKLRADYALPIVGRKEELKLVFELLRKGKQGLGQCIAVEAEAGLGKTRMLDEIVKTAVAEGFLLYFGECQTFGANMRYNPWWRIWRGFYDLMGTELPDEAYGLLTKKLFEIDPKLEHRAPLLGPVLNIPIPDNTLTRSFDLKLRRASLDSLLVESLRRTAQVKPILIVMEDVHAIDPLSRELLITLIQAIARIPVVIIFAHRPAGKNKVLTSEEEELDYFNRIHLSEFSEEESEELIRLKFSALYGNERAMPHGIVDHISRKTGGNPFFIDEVMNWIQQQNIDLDSDGALDGAELPVSLYALVLSRMDQLDENVRVTMKVASVIGRIFQAAIVWGVYPGLGDESKVLTFLNTLSQSDFTVEEDGTPELAYLFKHVVIHEVAYESLPKELRSTLHENIGLYIERNSSSASNQILDLLAFHFGRSSDIERQKKYFVLAGDAARKAYSLSSAASYYRSALPLLEPFDQVPVRKHLGEVLEFSGDWSGAMQNYQKSLELSQQLNRHRNQADCKLRIGDMCRKRGEFEEAGRWLEDAQKSFGTLNEDQGIGQALHSAGTLAAQMGDYARSQDCYTRSLEIRRRIGDEAKVASLLSNTGIVARFQGDLPRALALQEESLSIRRKLKDTWAIGNSLNNLAMVKRSMDDFSGARKDLDEAVRILEKVGDRAEIANTLNTLAEVALDQEDTKACSSYLQESVRLTREIGNLRGIAFLFEASAQNAFLEKRMARCLRLFGAARSLRQKIGAPLPAKEQEKVGRAIESASQSLDKDAGEKFLNSGSNMPLSEALDYAASPASDHS